MKKIVIFILTISILTTACSDFLTQGPESSMSASQVFSKAESIDPYVRGLYKLWRNAHRERAGIYIGTDEMHLGGVQARDKAALRGLETYGASMTSVNDEVLKEWKNRYEVIAGAASLLEVLQPKEATNDSILNVLMAEACFLRAANYFELVHTWGAVPLIDFLLLDVYGNKRQPVLEVYKFIERDLKTAIKYLPDPGDPNYMDRSRASKCIAQALLGKLYLYADEASGFRDYEKARDQFEAVYENSSHKDGAKSYANIFNPALEDGVDQRREFIYAFRFSNISGDNNECQWYMGSRAVAILTEPEATLFWAGFDKVMPTEYCYSLKAAGGIWEDGDDRRDISIRYDFDDERTGEVAVIMGYCYGDELDPHCKKYEDIRVEALGLNTIFSGKPVPYIRYGDIALCYAECLYKTGEQSRAITIVNNKIRERAFGRLTSSQKWPAGMGEEEFYENLLEERMRELCFEGWRKMDLLRTGKLKEYAEKRNKWIKEDGTAIQPYHKLWPIPQDEINKNTDLTNSDQNPGY